MREFTYIYSLSDPFTGEIRYIGKANRLGSRLSTHITEAKKNRNSRKKGKWTRSLLEKGVKPLIEIIDKVSVSEWQYWEVYWISQFKAWGFDLLNETEGGECGIMTRKCIDAALASPNFKRGHKKGEFKHTEETKKIIKEKRAKQVFTEETRRKIGLAGKGRKYSAEVRQKMSKTMTGKPKSAKHKESIRLFMTKKVLEYGDNINKIWNSSKEIADFYNTSLSSVRRKIVYNKEHKKLINKFKYI